MTQEEKQKLFEDNKDISTAQIQFDIEETKKEIVQFTREEIGFRILGDRWSIMRADSRKYGIVERAEFILRLQAILEMREKLTLD